MKNILFLFLASLLPYFLTAQTEMDSTGFAGDHFSLEGALDLFKKAKSPEAFEKSLNDEKNNVNNLDLNEDGDVDYVRVIDNMDGDVHALVLQVSVNEKESQDIAVIEIEKTGKESAILQIIGNEDVFGEELIAEPFEEETKGSKNKGPSGEDYYTTRIVVNVWFYPCVKYVYAPNYIVWVSPWRWMVYPRWWSPWRPHAFHVFHRHSLVWRPHYHRVTTHRVVNAHKVYAPRRTSSVTVKKKTTIVRTNKVTRSTTVGVKKNSNRVVAGKKTTKTAVKKDGNRAVAGQKTTRTGVKKDGKKVTAKKQITKAGVKKSPRGTTAGKKTTKTTARKKGTKSAKKKTTKTTKTTKRKKKNG